VDFILRCGTINLKNVMLCDLCMFVVLTTQKSILLRTYGLYNYIKKKEEDVPLNLLTYLLKVCKISLSLLSIQIEYLLILVHTHNNNNKKVSFTTCQGIFQEQECSQPYSFSYEPQEQHHETYPCPSHYLAWVPNDRTHTEERLVLQLHLEELQ